VLYAGSTSGVFKTTDGGKRWRRTSAGIKGNLIANLEVDARDPDTLYVTASGKSDSGVFKSSDGGQTWTSISAGLPRSELEMLAHDPSRAGVVYAGTRGGGTLPDDRRGLELVACRPAKPVSVQRRGVASRPAGDDRENEWGRPPGILFAGL
jgi:photosystem II stability/assembly factor-like uncharacterized protein